MSIWKELADFLSGSTRRRSARFEYVDLLRKQKSVGLTLGESARLRDIEVLLGLSPIDRNFREEEGNRNG